MATHCHLNPYDKSLHDVAEDLNIPEAYVIEQDAITIDETEKFEHGAYAKVIRVSYHGANCRGKRVHTILTEFEGEPRLDLVRFVQECRITNTFRHPNIVQYFGVCMDGPIPMLIMEELACNLYDFLANPLDFTNMEDIFETTEGEAPGPEGETSVQEGGTPGQEGETSVQEGETSVQERGTPGQEGETSVQEGGTPGQEGETSVQEGEIHVQEGETPVQEGETPVQNGTTQLCECSNNVSDNRQTMLPEEGVFEEVASAIAKTTPTERDNKDSLAPNLKFKKRILYPIKIRLALDIAQGLCYLHNKRPHPVVHRDLSSRNVLITINLRAKLVDFGQAKEIKKEKEWSSMNPGTLQYLAPELLENGYSVDNATGSRSGESRTSLELDPSLCQDGGLSRHHFGESDNSMSDSDSLRSQSTKKINRGLPFLRTSMDMYSYGVLLVEIGTEVCPTVHSYDDHQKDLTDMEEQNKDRVLYEVASSVLKYKQEERASAKVIVRRLTSTLSEYTDEQRSQNQELRDDRERTSHGFLIIPKRERQQGIATGSTSSGGFKTRLYRKFANWTKPTPERRKEIAKNFSSV